MAESFLQEGGVDFLADERKKSQFDVDALKIVWAGGEDEFEVSDRMARLVASDPVISLTLILDFVAFQLIWLLCDSSYFSCYGAHLVELKSKLGLKSGIYGYVGENFEAPTV